MTVQNQLDIDPSEIPAIMFRHMNAIAAQQSVELAPLANDLPLVETGLDSLCIAIIVATLDDELGIDPFSSGEDVEFPVTVGEFVRLYQNAARSKVHS